jgi:hypothetical protein
LPHDCKAFIELERSAITERVGDTTALCEGFDASFQPARYPQIARTQAADFWYGACASRAPTERRWE